MLLKKIFRITTTTDLATAIVTTWTTMDIHGTITTLMAMGYTNLGHNSNFVLSDLRPRRNAK
jgi:hypothetical protein